MNYLTRKKRPANSKEPGDEKPNDSVPWNMQMYQGFIEEDERKKKASREAKFRDGRASRTAYNSDSDESIKEIKRRHKKR